MWLLCCGGPLIAARLEMLNQSSLSAALSAAAVAWLARHLHNNANNDLVAKVGRWTVLQDSRKARDNTARGRDKIAKPVGSLCRASLPIGIRYDRPSLRIKEALQTVLLTVLLSEGGPRSKSQACWAVDLYLPTTQPTTKLDLQCLLWWQISLQMPM